MKTKYWLLIIIFIAIILRLASISSESLWLDEAFSAYHGQQSVEHILKLNDTNLPLYLLPIKLISYIGTSELLLRLPSLIFGVLAVLAMFFLGKKMFNEKVGLISAFILSISAYHIYYSQEARVYSLLTLLSILSMYYFLNIKENKWQYILSTALMMYAHSFGLLTLLVQNIYYLIKKPVKLTKWFTIQLILLILYIPGLIHLYYQIVTVTPNFWITKEMIWDMIHIHTIFSGGLILSGIFSTLFITAYIIAKKQKESLTLQTLWIFVPFLVPTLISIFKPIALPKYIIFVSIPFYILIAYSVSQMKQKWIIITLVLITMISSIYVYDQATTTNKEDWRSIVNYAESFNVEVTTLEPEYIIMPYTYYANKCFNNTEIYKCAWKEKIFGIWQQNKTIEKSYINYVSKIIYIKRDIGGSSQESEYFEFLDSTLNLNTSKEFPIEDGGIITVYFFTR